MLITGAALVVGLLGPALALGKRVTTTKMVLGGVVNATSPVELASFPYKVEGTGETVYLRLHVQHYAFLTKSLATGDKDGKGLDLLDKFYKKNKGTDLVRSKAEEEKEAKKNRQRAD
ncbi:MAG TPA: hypothetical protein VM537_31705 [Anaerolineae bacterium]|nr:hypothetical protein [Anaerolineae bacterium]